ncbi:MAG: uncharacterized protein JWP11_1365 [Frankiales bacterium]|nr:uncharacterized protein [Frankiales bacterium]
MAQKRVIRVWWRISNPLARPLAGLAPWWVLLETTGRRSGRRRRTPLASGPRDSTGMWLIAVHGRHSGWVLNAEARPEVRIRHRGRWRSATARPADWDPAVIARFNRYARSGPGLLGWDPVLVRLDFV